MNRFLITCMLLLGVAFCALAQEVVEVTGVVVDANKVPQIGVSVFVKDAPGRGTVTDNNGYYKINVDRYKTLVFSSLGFKTQEILVKDNLLINVTLQEAETSVLDEIIVTGTGT